MFKLYFFQVLIYLWLYSSRFSLVSGISNSTIIQNGENNDHTTGKKVSAIATILLHCEGKSMNQYFESLRLFLKSLFKTGYSNDLLLLITSDVSPSIVEDVVQSANLSSVSNIKIKRIERMNVMKTGVDKSYQGMLTKLRLWTLLDYAQIIYYDVDHVFLSNPLAALNRISSCSPKLPANQVHVLCATEDSGISFAGSKGNYFNAGFLVLYPNNFTYQWLLSNAGLAEGKTFAEQDMLNSLYQNNWHKLSKGFSQQFGTVSHKGVSTNKDNVVAMHIKPHELKSYYPEKYQLWSDDKINQIKVKTYVGQYKQNFSSEANKYRSMDIKYSTHHIKKADYKANVPQPSVQVMPINTQESILVNNRRDQKLNSSPLSSREKLMSRQKMPTEKLSPQSINAPYQKASQNTQQKTSSLKTHRENIYKQHREYQNRLAKLNS